MSKQQPNKIFAPLIIAGVTIGFLASAYKFIFAHSASKKSLATQQDQAEDIPNTYEPVTQATDLDGQMTP